MEEELGKIIDVLESGENSETEEASRTIGEEVKEYLQKLTMNLAEWNELYMG